MAASSSNLPPLNSPSLQNLPPPLFQQALHVDVRSNRRFVLAINWLSAFMLGMFNINGLAKFLKTQLRNEINAIIHGLWVEDLDGNHLKQETYTKISCNEVEVALYDILVTDKEMAEFLHTHWSDLHNWAPIQWAQTTVDSTSWATMRTHFAIVITQFLKHGHPNQMTLREYIYTVRDLYRKIDLTDYFRKSSALQFEGNTKRYSIISNTQHVPVYSTDLSDAFFKDTGRQAQFVFRAYKSKDKKNNRKKMCVFTELRVKFDLENNMVDQGQLFECNHFDHDTVFPRHMCVLFNHRDRKGLKEDTV